MNNSSCRVLYEDNHLLAMLKPAGVLTMGDDTDDLTMVNIAADYLKHKYNKPGNVFVGVVHRLDRPVSGVLLFARTSKAASRLSDQFRRGSVKKIYRAVVTGRVPKPEDTLTDWLHKDREQNVVSVVGSGVPKAQKSILTYKVLKQVSNGIHLQIEPLTGRSHQIRVQLASRQMPINGDVKYGSSVRQGGRISLHAESLQFDHPTTKQQVVVTAEVPADL